MRPFAGGQDGVAVVTRSAASTLPGFCAHPPIPEVFRNSADITENHPRYLSRAANNNGID